MPYTAFRALKRDSIKCDLYDVHTLIFDEMQMNYEALDRLFKKLAAERDPKVFSSLQQEYSRITHMIEGLKSLQSKISARLDEYRSLANTTPTESVKVHSISPGEISNSTVLHTTTKLLPEKVNASTRSDGDEEINKG